MKKFLKIILLSFIILLCSFTFLILLTNSTKFFIYKDYFNIAKDVAVNEGLGDGYIPQGVAKLRVKTDKNDEYEDIYLTSGYMSNGKPSRIYVISKNNAYYVEIKLNDYDLCDYYLGGISTINDKIIVSAEGRLMILNLDDVLNAKFEDTMPNKPSDNDVMVEKMISTGVLANYVYADTLGEYVYVGEFNGYGYKANHGTLVNSGKDTYHAYIEKYRASDIFNYSENPKPVLTYAVRDLVQGFAISDKKIMLSTSYGLHSSYFYVYDVPTEIDDNENNIIYLDDRYLKQEIKAPALAGALDYDGEKFYTLYKSACNKYFFGKFFFANKIVGIKL